MESSGFSAIIAFSLSRLIASPFGGSVVTWGQMNRAKCLFSAIESLRQRGFLQPYAAMDGMTETFELHQELFDYANSRRRRKKVKRIRVELAS